MKKYTEKELESFYKEDYVDAFKQSSSQQKRIVNICNYVNFSKDEVIADIGCGIGLLYYQIHNRIKTYHGVDFSQSFINSFKEIIDGNNSYNNIKLHCEDVVSFCDTHPNNFNKITTLDFSEHIYDDKFIKIYSAIKSALNPEGGELILHTPNKTFIFELLKQWGVLPQIKEHIGVRNAHEYEVLLQKCGYTKITTQFIPHYNTLKHLHVLSYIPIVGSLFKARILIKAS